MIDQTRRVIEECRKLNDEFHPFMTISDDLALSQAKDIKAKKKAGRLAGLYVSVKDCICVKDVQTRAGSRILEGYRPVFDATVIERLKGEDATIIGKTSQDAWGFGSFNTNVGLGYEIPLNPVDKERATGGSSGGGATITRLAEFNHVALTESTGGSIECPASFCGVVGFCPTYGRLSRWGLICYADSLDKIGLMSRSVDELYPVLEVVAGHDPKDGTSLKAPVDLSCNKDKFKVGIIKETMGDDVNKDVRESVQSAVGSLKAAGHHVEEVSLPVTMKYGIYAYYLLATSEASTNLARYCGLRYGKEGLVRGKSFNDYFTEVRSKHFNDESKRRIILGTFARMAGYRDAYYLKATKVRTKVIEEYKEMFKEYDVLISPTMPILPPRFKEIEKLKPVEIYMMDALTAGPNLSGIPHASIPVGEAKGLPVGMMASTDHLEEGKLLKFLKVVEGLR